MTDANYVEVKVGTLMLRSARYTAVPHAKSRNHKMPIEVIESLAEGQGSRGDQCALDKRPCLFEIVVVSGGQVRDAIPPVVLKPQSGGEVFVGKRAVARYPEDFSPGDYLVVQVTPL